MKTFTKSSLVFMSGAFAMAGCAASSGDTAEDDTPDLILDNAEAQQKITNVNSDGTWTADALSPIINIDYMVRGKATFTGPSGKTRKMGVCALKKNFPAIACTSDANCPAPPSGGYKYCTAPNGTGTKYCFFRPGAASTWCAGSPANGFVPIAPGTISSVPQFGGAGTQWISYACFEGCVASDPSSSSAAYTTTTCGAACQ